MVSNDKAERSDRMTISTVIVTYNNIELTKKCLGSVLESMRAAEGSGEVIVVDNGSEDETVEEIRRRWPEVNIVETGANRGYAAAANAGIVASKGEYVLLCNNDVVLERGVVAALRGRLDSMARLAAVGPKIVGPDGVMQNTHRRKQFYSKTMVCLSLLNQFLGFSSYVPLRAMGRFPTIFGRIHDRFETNIGSSVVEWVDGMCVMFRRKALEMSGLFDEQYFFDMEIGDLLFRLRIIGWTIYFDCETEVLHYGKVARAQNPGIALASHNSELVYYAKYRPEYLGALQTTYKLGIGYARWKIRLRLRGARKAEALRNLQFLQRAVARFKVEDAIALAKIRWLRGRENA